MATYGSNNIPDESLRLEIVTSCVGFDDILDETLSRNHGQSDTYIVVTSHEDRATQACAAKHGAICVQTDLFKKNGRIFNKGAALNAGFNRFQYYGWRLHLDSDIVLPDNFRRVLFNHTHLDKQCLYGADRVNIIGLDELNDIHTANPPQNRDGLFMHPVSKRPIEARYICNLNGYVPLGFFQLWHAASQKDYPYSLGTAAHDDIMFGSQWALQHRVHLPSIVCYHLCAHEPKWGQNWEGRKSPRIK